MSSMSRSRAEEGGNPAGAKDSCEDDEDRLDKDFLFYLSFCKVFMSNLEEGQEIELCESWLQKLCGQVVSGVRSKRTRNIYLSNLILMMLEGQLSGIFVNRPPKGKLADALKVFGPDQSTVHEEPEWMDEVLMVANDLGQDYSHHSADGRTYIASKQLPNGRGAFGFISITLGEKEGDEDLPCAGIKSSDTEMPEEVKQLLNSRNSPCLRNNLIRFYENMIKSIDHELSGVGYANESVNLMMENMDDALKCACKQAGLDKLDPATRRLKTLEMIRERLVNRMEKVTTRGKFLDDLEAKAKAKRQEGFGPHEELLLQEAEMDLSSRDLHSLQRKYPQCLIVKFIELLKKEKKTIIEREKEQLEKFAAEVKKDQLAIIKEEYEKYKAAKKEWEDMAVIISTLQKAIKKGWEDSPLTESPDHTQKNFKRSLEEEVEREQKRYEKSMHEKQHLREAIDWELERTQNLIQASTDERDMMKRDNTSLRKEIESLQMDITFKNQKIQELENLIRM